MPPPAKVLMETLLPPADPRRGFLDQIGIRKLDRRILDEDFQFLEDPGKVRGGRSFKAYREGHNKDLPMTPVFRLGTVASCGLAVV